LKYSCRYRLRWRRASSLQLEECEFVSSGRSLPGDIIIQSNIFYADTKATAIAFAASVREAKQRTRRGGWRVLR